LRDRAFWESASGKKGKYLSMALDPAIARTMNMIVAAPLLAANPTQALDAAVHEVFERMLGIPDVESSDVSLVIPSAISPLIPSLSENVEILMGTPKGSSSVGASLAQQMGWQQPVSAILGFAGKLSGACTMSAESEAVAVMSWHLLSPPLSLRHSIMRDLKRTDSGVCEWPHRGPYLLDDALLDAFGEICNMIAGGWKNRMPGLDSGCALSVPTIVSGSDYELHPVGDRLLVERIYHFCGHRMLLAIRCAATDDIV